MNAGGGRRCRVIVSGGNPQHHEQAEADNYAPFLLARGVSPSDLVLENESLNTYQNARNVAGIVQPERDETLVLITSAYHMRTVIARLQCFWPRHTSVHQQRAAIQGDILSPLERFHRC